ncbi:MAG: hypothetical protein U1F34_06845 [Gammaproteobacteria bacterium]
MKPVCILQHDYCNTPAYFGDFLSSSGVPWQLLRLDLGDSVPCDLSAFSGLCFMGGMMSVNDEAEFRFLIDELRLIREAHAAGLPVIECTAWCATHQQGAGWSCSQNHVPEVGWHTARSPSQAQQSRVARCNALDDEVTLFQWHEETFSLPAGTALLLQGNHCHEVRPSSSAIASVTKRIEVTPQVVQFWAGARHGELNLPSESVQSAATILDIEGKIASLRWSLTACTGIGC